MPNLKKLLRKCNVPENLIEEAANSFSEAKNSARGLLWKKWKVRLFKASKIKDMLEWSDERLIDIRPDLADWDIAPMINITAHGDNVPWSHVTDLPVPGVWLNYDQSSAEYKEAVKANYWLKGTHPRSKESRKAWYRRNAGEYVAWKRGKHVDLSMKITRYVSDDGKLEAFRCGSAWQLKGKRGWLKYSLGYEIANVFGERDGKWIQKWYPIENHDLRAPVTWSILPG